MTLQSGDIGTASLDFWDVMFLEFENIFGILGCFGIFQMVGILGQEVWKLGTSCFWNLGQDIREVWTAGLGFWDNVFIGIWDRMFWEFGVPNRGVYYKLVYIETRNKYRHDNFTT